MSCSRASSHPTIIRIQTSRLIRPSFAYKRLVSSGHHSHTNVSSHPTIIRIQTSRLIRPSFACKLDSDLLQCSRLLVCICACAYVRDCGQEDLGEWIEVMARDIERGAEARRSVSCLSHSVLSVSPRDVIALLSLRASCIVSCQCACSMCFACVCVHVPFICALCVRLLALAFRLSVLSRNKTFADHSRCRRGHCVITIETIIVIFWSLFT
jgi:hypothetical protein